MIGKPAKKKAPTAGSFKAGPDPRRHVFTAAERRKGYKAALANPNARTAAYVFRKVRGIYRAKKRAAQV